MAGMEDDSTLQNAYRGDGCRIRGVIDEAAGFRSIEKKHDDADSPC